ncbi:MAG: hypothetical protein ABIM19_07130 [candidate division WOR-3 bacterium]
MDPCGIVLLWALVAQPADTLKLLARELLGPSWGLLLDGNILYVATGGTLCAVDVSDPHNPIILSHDHAGDVTDQPSKSGDVVYVGANVWGFYAFDVRDPNNIRKIGVWPPSLEDYEMDPNEHPFVGHLRARGNYLYAPGFQGGHNWLKIFDVSDPQNPVERGTFYLDGMTNPYSCELVSDTVAVVALGTTLVSVNIKNPDNPFGVDTLFIPGITSMTGLRLFGDTLLVSNMAGLARVSVSDPSNMQVIDTFARPLDLSCTWDAYSWGNHIFLADGLSGLTILDADLDVVSRLSLSRGDDCMDVVVRDGIAYIAWTNLGLVIADVSDPESPKEIARLDLGSPTRGSAFLGDTLYMALDEEGLYVFSTSIPEKLDTIGHWRPSSFEGRAKSLLAVSEGPRKLVYMAAAYGGLYILDVTNPSDIQSLYQIGSFGEFVDLAISGTTLFFIASRQNLIDTLTAYDVEDPESPSRLGFLPMHLYEPDAWAPTPNTRIDVLDGRAYIASKDSFYIVDVSAPEQMSILSAIPLGCGRDAEVVIGNGRVYAYVGQRNPNSFLVVDVTDPVNPEIVREIEIDWGGEPTPWGGITHLRASDSLLYVLDRSKGLFAYWIADPENPVLCPNGHFQHNGNDDSWWISLRDDGLIYASVGCDGVYVFGFGTTDLKELQPEPDKALLRIRNSVGVPAYTAIGPGDVSLWGVDGRKIKDLPRAGELSGLSPGTYVIILRDWKGKIKCARKVVICR